MAKITFLGTGVGGSFVGRGIRSAGGFVLSVDGNEFLVNPGPGVLQSARKADVNLRKIIGVFLTDASFYSTGGLTALFSAMTYDGLDPHGILLGPKQAVDRLSYEYAEKVVVLDSTPRVGINNSEIEIIYGDDVSYVFKSFDGSIAIGPVSADTIILSLRDIKNADELLTIVANISTKALILTDVPFEIHKSGTREFARRISSAVSFPVIMAEDGLIVDSLLYR